MKKKAHLLPIPIIFDQPFKKRKTKWKFATVYFRDTVRGEVHLTIQCWKKSGRLLAIDEWKVIVGRANFSAKLHLATRILNVVPLWPRNFLIWRVTLTGGRLFQVGNRYGKTWLSIATTVNSDHLLPTTVFSCTDSFLQRLHCE